VIARFESIACSIRSSITPVLHKLTTYEPVHSIVLPSRPISEYEFNQRSFYQPNPALTVRRSCTTPFFFLPAHLPSVSGKNFSALHLFSMIPEIGVRSGFFPVTPCIGVFECRLHLPLQHVTVLSFCSFLGLVRSKTPRIPNMTPYPPPSGHPPPLFFFLRAGGDQGDSAPLSLKDRSANRLNFGRWVISVCFCCQHRLPPPKGHNLESKPSQFLPPPTIILLFFWRY